MHVRLGHGHGEVNAARVARASMDPRQAACERRCDDAGEARGVARV